MKSANLGRRFERKRICLDGDVHLGPGRNVWRGKCKTVQQHRGKLVKIIDKSKEESGKGMRVGGSSENGHLFC